MGEAAEVLDFQPKEVTTRALSIIDQGKAIVIKTADDYKAAGELWITIKGVMKQADDAFDPIIDRAHKTWKEALKQKANIYDPLKAVYVSVKGLMSTYDAEQERLRQAEQRRLEEIARKAEEERLLQEAIAAEAAGDKEEAAAIMEEPVYVAPVVLQKTTPKLAGGPVYRTVWKFRITDPAKIPRQYLIPDEKAIGGVIRSTQGKVSIPGVEAYEERC